MDELIHWPVFQLLGRKMITSVKVATVFNKGNASLYVDFDDDVFCSVIVPGTTYRLRTDKLDDLCGKNIISFDTGRPCVALSADGTLHSCQKNCDQLGDVETSVTSVTNILDGLQNLRIVEVSCGRDHCIALSDDNRVLTWGSNMYGQCGVEAASGGLNQPQFVPNLPAVCHVKAMDNLSACLSKLGTIYLWGDSDISYHVFGGKSRSLFSSNPKGDIFKQLMLGKAHGLALKNDGQILTWGCQQYPSSRTDMYLTPVLLNAGSVRFIEIATHKSSSKSAALSTNGVVYTWDHDGQGVLSTVPVATCLPSLDSVFAYSEDRRGSYRNIRCRPTSAWTVMKSFDNPDDSDCTFVVEEHHIHAHKLIMILKSDYFRKMFDGAWKESGNVVTITSHSYPVYRAMLEFFYTDRLEIDSSLLPEVLQLAHETLHTALVDECVRLITNHLEIEDVCTVHELAITLELDELKESCRRFARSRLTDVLRSKSFAKLPGDIGHKFICSVSENSHYETDDPPSSVSMVKRKAEQYSSDEAPAKKSNSE